MVVVISMVIATDIVPLLFMAVLGRRWNRQRD
jgi:hypothetical protein